MKELERVKSTGGIAPFGYRWRDGKLLVDEKEAPVRELIYELFLKHRRKKTVAKILNDSGYRTRNGALFSDTTVDRLIRDATAKGERIVSGEKITNEAIVSPDLWQRANNLLGTKPLKRAIHLFAGIAFCSCGGKMLVPGSAAKYVCSNCRHKIGTDDLEEIFQSQLAGFVIPVEKDSGGGGGAAWAEEANLAEIWQHLDQKEKRIIIEQILNKITIGKTEIDMEFACAPDSFKTATFGQQSARGNETPKTQREDLVRKESASTIKEPLLSEANAAKFLGISKMTLLRRRNTGEIGFFRVGFRVLYSKEKHLIPFLENCEK